MQHKNEDEMEAVIAKIRKITRFQNIEIRDLFCAFLPLFLRNQKHAIVP